MGMFNSKNWSGTREEIEGTSALEQILWQGAQKMLQKAIEWEVQEYLKAHESEHNKSGHH